MTNWLLEWKKNTHHHHPLCRIAKAFHTCKPAPFLDMFVFVLFGFNELQIMSFGVNHLPNTRLFSAMSPLHHTLHSPPSTLQLCFSHSSLRYFILSPFSNRLFFAYCVWWFAILFANCQRYCWCYLLSAYICLQRASELEWAVWCFWMHELLAAHSISFTYRLLYIILATVADDVH